MKSFSTFFPATFHTHPNQVAGFICVLFVAIQLIPIISFELVALVVLALIDLKCNQLQVHFGHKNLFFFHFFIRTGINSNMAFKEKPW